MQEKARQERLDCKAVEKANAGSVELYVCMAKAFLDDKDAMPHKLERYYHYIAEK